MQIEIHAVETLAAREFRAFRDGSLIPATGTTFAAALAAAEQFADAFPGSTLMLTPAQRVRAAEVRAEEEARAAAAFDYLLEKACARAPLVDLSKPIPPAPAVIAPIPQRRARVRALSPARAA